MVGEYVYKAMLQYLKDNGIKYGELEDNIDTIVFDWIDANTTIEQIRGFEAEFDLFQSGHGGVQDGKWLDVEFIFTEN